MFRHTAAHFTCIIATHDNKRIFIDDVKSFNVVIESLSNIYSQNSTGRLFLVYIKATDFISLGLNGSFKVFKRSESKSEKRKTDDKVYPLSKKLW